MEKETEIEEDEIIASIKRLIRETAPEGEKLGPDDAKFEALIAKQLSTIKITKENIDPGVLAELESKTVRLELPTGGVVNVPRAGTVPSFYKIIDDLMVGNNVYLYGEAGTGKTTLAENIAAAIQREYITINCNQWTSPINIIGGQTIEGYSEGALIKAWQEGKMLILDELPKLDSNTAGLLNDALAKSDRPKGATIFNGKGDAIKKHKNFCCIASGNTTGKGTSQRYNGNNKQDLSLLDRFSGSFYEIGFNKELERSLLHKVVFDICDRIRDEIMRVSADEIMTLRTMLQVNKIYHLEMKRELGLISKVPQGKTLIDALGSYFGVMNRDKADLLKVNVNFDLFKNTYRDRGIFMSELNSSRDPDLNKVNSRKAGK
ncbi:MAG TPA: AAA family ATPase [Cytophagaceae bacterium]|jgi:cobaltochelatase CobS